MRFLHLQTYRDAYVSLSVLDIVRPAIRLELLDWNPLQVQTAPRRPARSHASLTGAASSLLGTPLAARQHPTELDRQHWHTALLGYGIRSDEEPRDGDEDLNIIPGVLEKVVLPKLTGAFRRGQRNLGW